MDLQKQWLVELYLPVVLPEVGIERGQHFQFVLEPDTVYVLRRCYLLEVVEEIGIMKFDRLLRI